MSDLDPEEACIQEVIARFYTFFGNMVLLKNDIECLMELDHGTKDHILYQLEEIEREYKASQEWFVSRDVQDVRVGVVGSERSLKTALVSLFVEGVLEIEGDEKDGRSKSKINVDGKSKLLLIREETCYPGGYFPSKQLCQWADIILFVFNHHDDESLAQVVDFYRVFRDLRENPEVPVMLVGIKGTTLPYDSPTHVVKEQDVRKTVELMDRCIHYDISLNQHTTYNIFSQACRLAVTASASISYLPTCPIFPSSPSQNSISSGAGGQMKYQSGPPPSPSQFKRGNRKKTGFGFGSTKATYSVKQSLTSVTESYGSGRHIPVKEGPINKKSAGGLRAEWKKKYLVLSGFELTYYPSLNDYMTQTHGKTLNLQHITVKVPGKRLPGVARTTTAPAQTTASDQTDSGNLPVDHLHGNQSDHSNSVSPIPPELEFIAGSTTVTVTTASPRPRRDRRETRSPTSPDDEFSSSDTIEDIAMMQRFRYPDNVINNGRGHNRNSSMDEFMLQQLRTGGIAYHSQPDEISDRSATMSRIQGKKSKDKTKGLLLRHVPSDEAALSEGAMGSNESIGRPDRKKKGDRDRNSWIGERSLLTESLGGSQGSGGFSGAGGGKEKKSKGHKRQRSWAGNKIMDVQDGHVEAEPESSEFQVLSLDGKVWTFEASSPEEAVSWVKSVEDQIKKILSESISHKRVNSCNDIEKREIYTMEGNGFCADCNSPNPEWASLNYGCVLCIECSGVHRKLGSHISRVRSLSLDEWSPELISVMLAVGNKSSKAIWESHRPRQFSRPIYSSPREEREKFIRAKYIDKEFLAELPESDRSIAEQLMDVISADDVLRCLKLLAHANPEDLNMVHGHPDYCGPLHLACQLGRTVIMQLLVWNGADINLLDMDKRSPLFYARHANHQDCINILLMNNCIDEQSPVSSDTGSAEVLLLTSVM